MIAQLLVTISVHFDHMYTNDKNKRKGETIVGDSLWIYTKEMVV